MRPTHALAIATFLTTTLPVVTLADAASTNAEVVKQYIEVVVNGRDFERIDEFVSVDLVQHNPNLPNGRDPLQAFWSGFLADLPEARFESVRMISENDLVVDHSVFYPAEDATGVAVVDIYRLQDGLIVQHWDVSMPIPEETASGNHPVYAE